MCSLRLVGLTSALFGAACSTDLAGLATSAAPIGDGLGGDGSDGVGGDWDGSEGGWGHDGFPQEPDDGPVGGPDAGGPSGDDDGWTSDDGGTNDGGVRPSPLFDIRSISVERDASWDLCRLSPDHQKLLVRLRNTGPVRAPRVTVEVRTQGTQYAERASTEGLFPNSSIDLAFDRGALLGFAETWSFDIVIDPDGAYGPAQPSIVGSCADLRTRAASAMGPLFSWYNHQTGMFSANADDWWRTANIIESVIDYTRETGDPTYFDRIDNSFERLRPRGFVNDYYADGAFWALAWIKAFDLTQQPKFLDAAKIIFGSVVTGWDASVCGGGLFFRRPHDAKITATNAVFLTFAARLAQRTTDTEGRPEYLRWAKASYEFLRNSGLLSADHRVHDALDERCKPEGGAFTHNHGLVIGGLVELWRVTGDDTLLDQAEGVANVALSTLVDGEGVLTELACEPDCTDPNLVPFKGIFVRNMAELYEVRPDPRYQEFLLRQSDFVWTRARSSNNYFGQRWQGPFDAADAARQSAALDALTSAVRAGNMNLALDAKLSTEAQPCFAWEQVERVADGSSRAGSKWCSFGSGGHVLNVDLGALRTIVGYRLRHAGAGGEDAGWNTRAYEIELSPDGMLWAPSVTVTDNTESVSTHLIPATKARYVRLHVTQTQTRPDIPSLRIYEFEVLGVQR